MADGVLILNKPTGLTSHDVVNRVRRVAKTRRVGHAGTLDPLANGVLVVAIGRATRVMPWLVGLPKTYSGEITLGAQSETYDSEGSITPVADPSAIELSRIRDVFRSLTGWLDQQAPPYSAVKAKGKKLYEYARQGEEVPQKVRQVWVESFEPVRYLCPKVTFVARVGSGTYIRSLAHEVGQRLGCGAYLSLLCRTRVGAFHIDDSITLEELENNSPEEFPQQLLSIPEALTHLPKIILTPAAEARMRNGRPFDMRDIMEYDRPQPISTPALVLTGTGEALAVVEARPETENYHPLCVLA